MTETSCYQKTGETVESSSTVKPQSKVCLETHERMGNQVQPSEPGSVSQQSVINPQPKLAQSLLLELDLSSSLGNCHEDILLPGCTNVSVIEPSSDKEDSSLDISAIFSNRPAKLQNLIDEQPKNPIVQHIKTGENKKTANNRTNEILRGMLSTNSQKTIPSKLYCPSCCKYTRPSVQIIPSHNSWWSHLLCQICVLAPESFKARHCCPQCSFTLLSTPLSN